MIRRTARYEKGAAVGKAYRPREPAVDAGAPRAGVELGPRLSIVKNAYNYEIFHEAFGRPGVSDHGAATLVCHALGRWTHQT
jgi:hypothetical protein